MYNDHIAATNQIASSLRIRQTLLSSVLHKRAFYRQNLANEISSVRESMMERTGVELARLPQHYGGYSICWISVRILKGPVRRFELHLRMRPRKPWAPR